MSRRSLATGHFAPFQTFDTTKVYAKVGEKICVSFSMQGKTLSEHTGHIVIRRPNGTQHSTSGSSTTVGLIANRAEELGEPHLGGGSKPYNKYLPYIVTVAPGEEGIWEIDFMSLGDGTNHADSTMLEANGNWTQAVASGSSALIAAWDVSIADASNNIINGRVFTNLFVGTSLNGAFKTPSFYGKFYVLTPDGYKYLVDGNGMNGASFSFFSNNMGPVDPVTKKPNYKSFSYPSSGSVEYIAARIRDPRLTDGNVDYTNKLFYNLPAADMPATATWTNGPVSGSNTPITTWLNPELLTSEVTDLTMTCDGHISFKTNKSVNYIIKIEKLDGTVVKSFTGTSVFGETNFIIWDKMTDDGVAAEAGTTIKLSVFLQGGEVHFPLIDAESNMNGIKIQQIGSSSLSVPTLDTLYWDDSNILSSDVSSGAWSGRSKPLKNTTGLRSSINGHIWGGSDATEANSFGNNKVLDSWSYVLSDPFEVSVDLCMVINGYVWNDVNGNVTVEGSESTVSEILYVNLVDEDNIVIATVEVWQMVKFISV